MYLQYMYTSMGPPHTSCVVDGPDHKTKVSEYFNSEVLSCAAPAMSNRFFLTVKEVKR
jgi:hypothetical protein